MSHGHNRKFIESSMRLLILRNKKISFTSCTGDVKFNFYHHTKNACFGPKKKTIVCPAQLHYVPSCSCPQCHTNLSAPSDRDGCDIWVLGSPVFAPARDSACHRFAVSVQLSWFVTSYRFRRRCHIRSTVPTHWRCNRSLEKNSRKMKDIKKILFIRLNDANMLWMVEWIIETFELRGVMTRFLKHRSSGSLM